MGTAPAFSRIWPGMPSEADKREKTMGSGLGFVGALCVIAGLAMITTSAGLLQSLVSPPESAGGEK